MRNDNVNVVKAISGILIRMSTADRERLYRDFRPTWDGVQPESDEEAISWINGGGGELLTQVFRRLDITNEEVRILVSLGLVKLHNPKAKPKYQARLTAFGGGISPNAPGVPLDQLAVMSSMVLELALEAASALEPFTKEMEHPEALRPPLVSVNAGSIQFTIGGPLLASGVGLAVAVSAGMLASPIAIPAASFLATAGVVDLVVGWWKTIAEGKKAWVDAQQVAVDTPTREEAQIKRALERRKQELEILKAERELATMSGAPSAPSRLIPLEELRRQAEIWGLSEPACTHVLNRTLAMSLSARRILGPMQAVPGDGEDKRGQKDQLRSKANF